MEIYLNNLIITIDGPSGSGKEKIAKYIVKKYKLYHLDSGILYRRLTAKLLLKKINFNDSNKINKYLQSVKSISYRKHKSLRNEEIGKKTSQIAANPQVRKLINKQQRLAISKLLKKNLGCVIDGRDIGSEVFKNAQLKLFIHVKLEIRAKRRHKQLIEHGEKSIHSQILKDLKLRDITDKSRKISPLTVPINAVIIDNSNSFKLTIIQIDEALKKLKQL